MTTYRVFKRRPWRRNKSGKWDPYGGARKITVERGVNLETARKLCTAGNARKERKPGQIYYEFESE